jgi:formylglycine-generating enzyme required for sulfatase activity
LSGTAGGHAGSTGWDVFISYTRADALAQAEALHLALAAARLKVFKDDRALRPGERWFGAIEDALASCRHFVVLLGPAGLDRWVGAETQVALSRHFSAAPGSAPLSVLPVLLQGTPPAVMRTFLAQFQSLHWSAGQGEPPAELVAALSAKASSTADRPLVPGCPYRGLAAFGREHAGLFFGRERDIVGVLARLGDSDPPRPGDDAQARPALQRQLRWLSIVGGSGTGKSSLLRAGLLPLVDAGALAARTGVERWTVTSAILPGADPLLELAKALSAALEPADRRDSAALLERLRRSDGPDADQALALWLADRLADDPGRAVLLVVDQFEELFTQAAPASRKRFDALLATALQASNSRLYLASTCRSDLAHRLADDLPQLAQHYNTLSRPYMLASMGLADLKRAIEQPAALAGLDVSELVQALLQDAREDLAGALPLVQHALTTLWAVRAAGPSVDGRVYPGGRLTLKAFDDAGRLAGILAREANGVLARIERSPLGKTGRHGAMELLLSLSHYQPDGRHTRQQLDLPAALRVAGQGDNATALTQGRQVLDILAGRREDCNDSADLRLVTIGAASSDAGAGTAEPRVDLIHEALLRTPTQDGAQAADKAAARAQAYWPMLVNYLVQHKDRDLLRQTLRAAAEAWEQAQDWWARLRLTASLGDLRRFRRLAHVASKPEQAYLRASRLPAALVSALVWLSLSAGILDLVAAAVIPAFEARRVAALKDPDERDNFNALRWGLFAPPPPKTVEIPLDKDSRYTMGCLPERDGSDAIKCRPDEAPREVDLVQQPAPCTAFGVYEITNDEYEYYVWSQRRLPAGQRPPPDALPTYPDLRDWKHGRHPVVRVSALDAEAYAQWLSTISKQTWRLPTEEEWEYAARAVHPSKPGGVEGPYWWGKESPKEHGRANCDGCDPRFKRESAPVGEYPSNAFGLHDTVGNVWEWTSSAYSNDNSPFQTESAGGKWVPRVFRGGSWDHDPSGTRASFRGGGPDFKGGMVGFRVCRAPPPGRLGYGAAER